MAVVAQPWQGSDVLLNPRGVRGSGMRDAIVKLERLGDETRRDFEGGHRGEAWFQKWQAMPEPAQASQATEAGVEEEVTKMKKKAELSYSLEENMAVIFDGRGRYAWTVKALKDGVMLGDEDKRGT